MTRTDPAATIRADLKSELGLTARQVSVRMTTQAWEAGAERAVAACKEVTKTDDHDPSLYRSHGEEIAALLAWRDSQ